MSRLIFLLLTVVMLYSCQDSLGYDPNVTIADITKDTTKVVPEDTLKSTVYQIDSVKTSFREFVKMMGRYKEYPWYGKSVKKRFKIDTSDNKVAIWIDWMMESTLKDVDYRGTGRMDRVLDFQLVFSAILDQRQFELNKGDRKLRFLAIRFKRIMRNSIYTVKTEDIKSQLIFVENDKRHGVLKFMIVAEFPPHTPIQVKRFDGLIEVYYKKN